MPLNLSGPISLAGSTTGQSIAVELGLSPTGSINLNQANVRTLAGVPSGAITMPTNFYGKSSTTYYSTAIFASSNNITRLNACGASLGNTTIAAFGAWLSASPTSSNVGVFYRANSSNVARINGSGALVGSVTNAGTARESHAGARAGANLLVWGGGFCCPCFCTFFESNLVTRINGSGALVGSEGSLSGSAYVSSSTNWAAARNSSSNAIFYGACFAGNRYQRVNSCGAKVGSFTTAGTNIIRGFNAGAQIGAGECGNGGVSAFFGGLCGSTIYNTLTRLNSCGALVGSVTNVGTARWRLGGASVGTIAIFYGGNDSAFSGTARATRVNVCGALVGSEISPVGSGLVETGSSASVV